MAAPGGSDPPTARKTSGLAIAAFVLACLFILPLVPSIGLVLGIVALLRLSSRPDLRGKGLAARSFANRRDIGGYPLPKAFPVGNTGWVPTTPCCKQATAPKCAPQPDPWKRSPWKELSFAPTEPHYFQWRYEGGSSHFTAEARADMDCDGTYSSFRISGTLTPDGNLRLSELVSENEAE